MFFPIRIGDKVSAALALATVGRPSVWSEREVAIAHGVAEQVGIAVYQARLFDLVSRGKDDWEATFDALSDAVFVFDADGALNRCNRAALRTYDLDMTALHEIRCCDLFGEGRGTGCIVEEAVAEETRVVREASNARHTDITLLTVDPIVPRDGGPARSVCIARDLTQLRAAEADANLQRIVLSTLVETASDVVLALDLDNRITWANTRAAKLFAMPSRSIVGRRVTAFLPQPDRARTETLLSNLATDTQAMFECVIRNLSNEERIASVSAVSLVVDGQASGALLVARDVTDERRSAARAAHADKLRALGRLASGVAHDFNNVLMTILGNTQLMRRQARDDESSQRLAAIENASLDGAATVRRIQEFARSRGEDRYEIVDLMTLVEEAIEFTRVRWENDARASGIDYEVMTSVVGERPTVLGDASGLREAFVNIMFNAFDAMPQGGTLRISCVATESEAVIRFTDTGVGIPHENLAQLFEPFFSTKDVQGAGLGLAVTYGVVSRHGGRIEATSDGATGATIAVVLPALETSSDLETSEAPLTSPRTLLVVDDDEPVRAVLAELLQAQGHRVEAAVDGHSALALLESKQFDVVFTDLSMPGIDGWEVARRVRANHPDVQIVLTTGFGNVIDSSVVPALVDAVVAKPFLYQTLALVLRDLADRKATR